MSNIKYLWKFVLSNNDIMATFYNKKCLSKQTVSSGNGGLQLNRLMACKAAFGGYMGGGGGSCAVASDFFLCSLANRKLVSLKCRS